MRIGVLLLAVLVSGCSSARSTLRIENDSAHTVRAHAIVPSRWFIWPQGVWAFSSQDIAPGQRWTTRTAGRTSRRIRHWGSDPTVVLDRIDQRAGTTLERLAFAMPEDARLTVTLTDLDGRTSVHCSDSKGNWIKPQHLKAEMLDRLMLLLNERERLEERR